jgi:hypothetical protein
MPDHGQEREALSAFVRRGAVAGRMTELADRIEVLERELRAALAAREEPRSDNALVIVALRTTDRHIQRRLETALSIAATYDTPPNTAPCVFAKPVGELVASDLDRLAEFMGWPAIRDLNLGVDVVTERDPKP